MTLAALLLPASVAGAQSVGQPGGARSHPHNSRPRVSLGRCANVVRGRQIVRANDTAVVYSGLPFGAAANSDLAVSACLLTNGSHWHVGGNGVDSLLENFRLRGPYFVWTDQTLVGPASVPELGRIMLVNLARRKTLVSNWVVDEGGLNGTYSDNPYQGSVSLPSVSIGPRGQLAWVGSGDAWRPSAGASHVVPHYEVWISYRRHSTQLDAGRYIAPRSLRMSASGTVVTWKDAGKIRSAPIS